MVKGYVGTFNPIIKYNMDLKTEWLKEGNLAEDQFRSPDMWKSID